jgi:hypothetical protein
LIHVGSLETILLNLNEEGLHLLLYILSRKMLEGGLVMEGRIKGECKLMMVSHDVLVAMKTWKNNNCCMLTWRDYSRYFYNEFEYGVKDET